MYPEERILIDKELKERNLEHLKCDFLYRRSYITVKEILDLPYWSNPKFQGLLTLNIWNSNAEEVQTILSLKEWEDPKFQGLLTSTIWNSNAEEVQTILSLKEWEDPKFQGLLTSSIWASNVEDIQKKLYLPYWNEEKYTKLLTPTIFPISVKRIADAIEVAETFNIEEWITSSFLKKSKIQLHALIHYLEDNQIPLIVNEKLHPFFSIAPSILKKKYHIDLKYLVEQEKLREVKLC